jgi:hypothetical protein
MLKSDVRKYTRTDTFLTHRDAKMQNSNVGFCNHGDELSGFLRAANKYQIRSCTIQLQEPG